ncbi:MAG: hypothetical protein JO104_01920 [Candidatus Eremiobacteraeota bacterium]|nr:hypothetical protein [Candidatus Eremiobacteraeota bacterium]
MSILGFRNYVVAACAITIALSGCGALPFNVAQGKLAQGDVLLPHAMPAVTADGIDRQAARGDLLYVTGGCGGTCVLSYPKGKAVGALPVGGAGLCSDRRGNVFIATATASGNAVVYEYAHGGTSPKATLSLPGLLAEGCSVDPTTGNLAVTYLCRNCDYGPVGIFQNAKGAPTSYQQAGIFLSYCGYDSKGNLFVDGSGSGGFALLELPAKAYILSPISVGQSITSAGEVQWDSTYLAIEDLSHPVIYQFAIKDSVATLKGTTQLTGAGNEGGQSWIHGGTVVLPYSPSGSSPTAIGLWRYPAGGSAKKTIKRHLGGGLLAGATVSVAR